MVDMILEDVHIEVGANVTVQVGDEVVLKVRN